MAPYPLPDALQVAAALMATNDAALKRVRELRVLLVGELEVE